MLTFLSPEWVQALDDAAQHHPLDAPAGAPCAVVFDVDGFRYHLVVDDGGLRFVAGDADGASVRLSMDRETAAAISQGHTSAQRAFMSGQLHIAGDVLALVSIQAALAAVGDLFAAVRERTEF